MPICGLFADADGHMNLCLASEDGGRVEKRVPFHPFIWTSSEADASKFDSKKFPLEGPDFAPLNSILAFSSKIEYDAYYRSRAKEIPSTRISSLENQFLLVKGLRMFKGMRFQDLKSLQLDIETRSTGGFPNPERQGDRIIAVGLSGEGGNKILEIADFTDSAERELLENLSDEILSRNPDTIEGHNIFKFDLDYILTRSKLLGAEMRWGRFGKNATYRKSRVKIAERTFDYPRFDIPGRTVVDTLIMLQLYDISARELDSYSLKNAALHFGISSREKRTYIRGDKIQDIFSSDRETFRNYLRDDLRETRGLANILLPTYFAQVKNFPLSFQECLLRGTGMKVETLFLEKYFAEKAALPLPAESDYFSGAISQSFKEGVFKNVMHYDVASLYPSIMIMLGECPKNDYLKIFLKELSSLRDYRLKYKKLAKEAFDSDLKSEYTARQNSFKILINSFYGYLGLSTAFFSDTSLADKVTSKGREILTRLIERFEELGCVILEADTDGIYVSSEKYFASAEKLLKEASSVMPEGIDLEFDGAYPAMLCYKAKNYALLKDDGTVAISGSAFRNRSQENFLRELTHSLINCKLGVCLHSVSEIFNSIYAEIESGKYPVENLAKSEYLTKSVDVYKRELEAAGKGRRAAYEAAAMLKTPPSVGEQISYYLAASEGGKTPDWKRARPVELFSADFPYDTAQYLKKMDDWKTRFEDLIGDEISEFSHFEQPAKKKSSKKNLNPEQGELF